MKHTLLFLFTLLPLSIGAQVTLSGSVQSDMLVPQADEKIGAEKTEDFQTNTYVDLMLQHQNFEAGVRMEYLQHPLPGFENDFKGWGVPHYYVKGKLDWAELTVGTFYEQFGSGFILRTYEERALGIDNSLRGGRLVVKPFSGLTIKALGGHQRRYWKWNKGFVSGADAEVNVDEWVKGMQQHNTRLTLGFSWVNKYEDEDYIERLANDGLNITVYQVRQPKYVNAWDARANLSMGNVNILAEYARKGDDPSQANGYIYGKGDVAMLSASYSKKGLSLLLQAKRSENMSFKSRRSMLGISSAINHLPAFTQDQTYALAALYPYATQLADGEWAYQAEFGYQFKRKTALGGKYGMNLKVNFSYVRSIDRQFQDGLNITSLASSNMQLAGTKGYTSKFFKWGDQTYYQDLDIQLSRKFSKSFQLSLMYMNQRYNKTVIEGHGGMIHSNIFIADGKYQFSPKTTLRLEAQYLNTKDDQGDWLYGLAELSLVPHWMLTISDMWNCGETKTHYYQGLVTFNVGAHRIQAGYGRTRAGYNCSGGVCRWIPAQKGFTLSYNYNF
ncbi:MAG: hypothetical protein IJQ76_02890 [Prevotella sp.]|nr:hypothetical protein [Prevotella sp.]